MADIEIERPHTLGRDELRQRLASLEKGLAERYGVKLSWQGDAAEVKASGVSGRLALGEQVVSVSLKLGLMMKPLAKQIREGMEKQLDRALA